MQIGNLAIFWVPTLPFLERKKLTQLATSDIFLAYSDEHKGFLRYDLEARRTHLFGI